MAHNYEKDLKVLRKKTQDLESQLKALQDKTRHLEKQQKHQRRKTTESKEEIANQLSELEAKVERLRGKNQNDSDGFIHLERRR